MELIAMQSRFQTLIENYQLEDQRFVRTPQVATHTAKERPKEIPLLGMVGRQLVCFGLLDFSEAKLEYTSKPDSVLLRSFSTDSRYLRKGYASEYLKLLPAYLRTNAKYVDEIVLSVDMVNEKAIHLYEKVGFKDIGLKIYADEASEYIMALTLH